MMYFWVEWNELFGSMQKIGVILPIALEWCITPYV